MLAQKDPYIDSAYHTLQLISQDRDKRLEYEAREKAVRDYNEGLLEAEERGIAIGEERGIAIGEERGIAIGEGRINKLNAALIRDRRLEDLARSTSDKDFQHRLMTEYGI